MITETRQTLNYVSDYSDKDSTTDDSSTDNSSTDNSSSVACVTVKSLPKAIYNSSGNQSRADQKSVQAITVTPVPDARPYCTTSHGQDIQIESQLSDYLEARNIPQKYLETLKHILSSENTPLSQVPLVDLQNMLRSLNFSQVSTEDDGFDQYNIKLIKTGAVFFTWIALNGTSIFNGSNNFSKINYVEHIIQTAKKLEKENHPVLVIYSTWEMSKACVQEMESYFANIPNIITLCKERDLELGSAETADKIHKNDHFRLEILTHQDQVLKAAIEQARQSDKSSVKSSVLKNLTNCRGSSLVYSDMDNHFIGHFPDYLIAFDGAIDAPKLSGRAMHHIRNNPTEYPINKLLTDIYERKYPLNPENPETSEEKIVISKIVALLKYAENNPGSVQPMETVQRFSEELSGLAELPELANIIIRKKISQHVKKVENGLLQNELDLLPATSISRPEPKCSDIFEGDNGFIICSYPNNEKLNKAFTQSSAQYVSMLYFHYYNAKGSNNCSACFYNKHHKKANRLAGYQLSKSIIIGRDKTWVEPESRGISFETTINGKDIITAISQECIRMAEKIGEFKENEFLALNMPVTLSTDTES